MSWEDYEALVETLEILGDDAVLGQLRKSIDEVRRGLVIPWEQVKDQLGR